MSQRMIGWAMAVVVLVLGGGEALAGPAIHAVPEPASLAVLAGGIGVLAAARYLLRK